MVDDIWRAKVHGDSVRPFDAIAKPEQLSFEVEACFTSKFFVRDAVTDQRIAFRFRSSAPLPIVLYPPCVAIFATSLGNGRTARRQL
ncbi:MAG: hypothetical protein WA650_04825 [Bradyrhizobium sp.]